MMSKKCEQKFKSRSEEKSYNYSNKLNIYNCKHIQRMSVGERHSAVSRERWYCCVCFTTESTMACLSCPYVACGSYISNHAFDHYKATGHHLMLDIYELFLYCFKCQDIVLNDNLSCDVYHLRESIQAILCKEETGTTKRGHAIRRATLTDPELKHKQQKYMDDLQRRFNLHNRAVYYNRFRMERKFFTKWGRYVDDVINQSHAAVSDDVTDDDAAVCKLQAGSNHKLVTSSTPPNCKRPLIEAKESEKLGVTSSASVRRSERIQKRVKLDQSDDYRKPQFKSISPKVTKQKLVTSSSSSFARDLMQLRTKSKSRSGSQQITPGVTGLKNLGNTCYLNSIIQVLGHLPQFRECLLSARLSFELNPADTHNCSNRSRYKGSSFETHLASPSGTTTELCHHTPGLHGGTQQQIKYSLQHSNIVTRSSSSKLLASSSTSSLCQQLNDLYHVMWSGKWKLVSPNQFLTSVWKSIPSFRGYSQQDAQEFLCELLDKIVLELAPKKPPYQTTCRTNGISKTVRSVFEGSLHSEVRCLECGHKSACVEPFWDLSLDFPKRYHSSCGGASRNDFGPCSLFEMLDLFTQTERLHGGRVYCCSSCNKSNDRNLRRSSTRFKKLSEAEKQIKIFEHPEILRFHIKRFRWGGRNHREKIAVNVTFPSELDITNHCIDASQVSETDEYLYDLRAVVIHHGRGFASGHYTSYCWNERGKFWVHCNDSTLELCSIEDVMTSQAYILFYSLRHTSLKCSNDISQFVSMDLIETNKACNQPAATAVVTN